MGVHGWDDTADPEVLRATVRTLGFTQRKVGIMTSAMEGLPNAWLRTWRTATCKTDKVPALSGLHTTGGNS